MTHVEDAHTAARDLVLVGGADPATGGADGLARRAFLVDELVVRKNEIGAIAHVQAPVYVDAIFRETIDFIEQRVRIQHDAVSDCALHARMHDPAWNLMEYGGIIADVHGMPGVRAPLITHDPVSGLSQNVDEFSLAFIAPLGANDD
jgi:hypothetical protein